MSYWESEPDSNLLSIFASNLSKSESESDSESDFNQFRHLRFFYSIYTLLNKLVDDFFLSIVKTESIVM